VLRRKWQFLICVGLIFGSAMVVISLLPSRYWAEATVRFAPADQSVGQAVGFLR